MKTEFAPSLLASDFSQLKDQIQLIKEADYLHLDVMDGVFVPNITFGPGLIKAIKKHTALPFDTHLMITKPELKPVFLLTRQLLLKLWNIFYQNWIRY
ncbi:MAG: ribulose-phosphate 3-epimerase [Halanaerobium sp.]|nr:MAG: ribulose-phosphate 3-epimerase [Halanaerobium sp.]